MSILVTGSIATDHLMTFPGKFAESLMVEQLDRLTLSFLVEDLVIRRGGCAANMSFGMACLGVEPVLVGAVGEDFVDYRSWLERHGVDCRSIRVSETRHTARFVCTNDSTMAQIASFYAGAMSEAREIELAPIVARVGEPDLVVISPNDPEGMLRHTDECRTRGYPFAADPSQQVHWSDGALIRQLVDGATYLFGNDYEAALTEQKTGWGAEEILDRVDTRIVTHGDKGVQIHRKTEPVIDVPAVPARAAVEPTGVGDAFRAGFVSGVGWGLGLERSAQVGCLLATYVVETVGTQEYVLSRDAVLERFAAAYGDEAAAEVAPHLHCPRP
ncbi:MAG: carbohydrate kinase family protein [Nocardioidaceae bacterium]